MGKIRVKTIGSEEEEQLEKKEDKKRKEAKKMAKAPGMKGGERVVVVGPTEEELEQIELKTEEEKEELKEEKKKVSKKKKRKDKKNPRSQRYQKSASSFDKSKQYKLSEAIELLKGLNKVKFDETVELHINVLEKGTSGSVTLPHGTGKQTKVAIADDELIAEIEKGKINFDILLADPAMMPKLAKVARVLGPKGLMPNPKNGTISTNPNELAKKYQGGHLSFRTETKSPIIHLTVGKISFENSKLEDNIKALISAVKKENIQKAILKSTMSPGIKLVV